MNLMVPGVSAHLEFSGQGDQTRSAEVLGSQDAVIGRDACHLGVRKGLLHQSAEGLMTAIAGRFYWRNRKLADHAKRHDAQATLALAYQEFGEKLLDQLGGRFSLVIWDCPNRAGLVATDRFGQNTVYWHVDEDIVRVAPTADMALAPESGKPGISGQALYHYLFFHMVPSPGTIYEAVFKLPAAHALRLNDRGVEPFCYWQPDFKEHSDKGSKKMGQEMLDLLQSSVAQLSEGEATGAFLSGGLDSSTVAGMLASAQKGSASTFSIGFDAEGYDEIAFARIASQHFKTRPHEYYVTPEDVLEILPMVAAAYDEPFGNSSAIPAYFCAKLARENGMDRLLAGDGGDELFAGNERYAKQTLFETYSKLPAGLRRYLIEPVLGHLPQTGLLGKLSSYTRQARIPLPARLHTYNFLTRFARQKLFDPSFLARVNPEIPFKLEDSIYQRLPGASRLNRMLYLDWQHTLADNDLRKVNRMCQLAGMEVEYPMLDDLVVELSTSIPSFRKMRFNRLRHFYKRAVSNFLPEPIINKSKHGFGLPFGVWMSTHAGLQDLARDSLTRFRERKILKPEFVDELMQLHDKSHAGYYGEFVWVLVMLELWLDQHGY